MESIEYNIISISDKRAENKIVLADRMMKLGIKEFYIPGVNGKDINHLKYGWARHPEVKRTARLRLGEMGIWLSLLDNLKYAFTGTAEHFIVMEDDAIPEPDFEELFLKYTKVLPEDYDFFSLWVPDNQRRDFYINYSYDWNGTPFTLPTGESVKDGAPCFRIEGSPLAKVYQGYGGVATMFSRKGAEKLYALARGEGTFTTSDCFLFINAHRGIIKGYAPRPDVPQMFTYDWKNETSIHDTPYIGV